jgi:hypothetical protein
MAEEKGKWYTEWKEYKVVTCASCGFLYKNGEKYCHDCGDDGVDISMEIYVTPIKPVRFIELNFVIDKENGECTFHSKE